MFKQLTKICTKCHERKPLSDFYRSKQNADGYHYQCKACEREYQIEYRQRQEVRKRRREWNREYRQQPEIQEQRRQYHREYRQRPEIQKKTSEYTRKAFKTQEGMARTAVNNAVRMGKLLPVSQRRCTDCGEQAEEYHHESYAKKDWLNVTPLCKVCHGKRHQIDD